MKQITNFRMALVCIIIIMILIGCGAEKDKIAPITGIKFGILPALQSLPLFVAKEKGLFKSEGLGVDLIMFNTATDKDIAITSGAIDGYFGDLFTPTIIESNGTDITIVAKNYSTSYDRRMFGLLVKPGAKYETPADLRGVPIAVSSNSVIEYVAETLMKKGSVDENDIAFVEVKNIGIRMQMLMSGQVEAATLPEPLVTAAMAGGAKLISDDSALMVSQTVLIFRSAFANEKSEAVRKFLKAVDRANDYINLYPDSVRSIMVNNVRLPEPLKDKYPIPKFPQLALPDSTTMEAVIEWLFSKNVISKKLNYAELADDRYFR